jgi:hypothetical protein
MIVRAGQRRIEHAWAWLSLFTLVLCWDASLRLEQRVSPPRVRIAHAIESEELPGTRERGVADRRTERFRMR